MPEDKIKNLETASPEDVQNIAPTPFKHEKIEELVFLLLTTRLNYLREEITTEFKSLKERQDHITELHKFQQALKTNKNDKGEIDFTNDEDMKTMVKRAKELGVNIKDDKTSYTKDQLTDLVDNVRMTLEDLNVQNDMQLQKVTRLTNERYESFQLARAIMKPLHEDKHNKARSASGR
jgi:Zn-dependent metalloprotease